MQVYSGDNINLTEITSVGKKVSVALGFFDGVHLGHMKLLEAAGIGRDDVYTVVRMFRTLPKAAALLTTNEEKLALLEKAGVDAVIFDDFTSMCGMSGRDFFESCILSLSPSVVVCGFNYRFGKGAECDSDILKSFCSENGITLNTVSEFSVNGRTVSSSLIRSLIAEGNIEEANLLLGRAYSVCDTIRHGKALGRTIGFPTVNQRPIKNKALPKNGIYAVVSEFSYDGEDRHYSGVCNIGSRPTVNEDESDITLETYIMDFSGDLYSAEVTTSFVSRLRGEIRFPSLDDLKAQISLDAENARKSVQSYTENITTK